MWLLVATKMPYFLKLIFITEFCSYQENEYYIEKNSEIAFKKLWGRIKGKSVRIKKKSPIWGFFFNPNNIIPHK